MAEQNVVAKEVLLNVKIADASNLYKFYLNQEKKILGSTAVIIFSLYGSLWAVLTTDEVGQQLSVSKDWAGVACLCSRTRVLAFSPHSLA
jgi:hypothetical protein